MWPYESRSRPAEGGVVACNRDVPELHPVSVDTTLSKQDREEQRDDKDIEETDLAVGAVGSEGERPTGRRGPKPGSATRTCSPRSAATWRARRGPAKGHRKLWARLRVIDGIRVGRTRVLRIMGENGLLSPHRRPPGPANDHDGVRLPPLRRTSCGAPTAP